MRSSNQLIGMLNFIAFLASIPVLGSGIWVSSRANTTDCMRFLQWPLLIIGIAIMLVSLIGLAGAFYHNIFLVYLYLWAMFFVIATLLGFVIFGYAVTDKGQGRAVLDRGYLEYYLQDYSGWLEERVTSQSTWMKISYCIRDSHVCGRMRRNFNGISESPDMFYARKLTSIQSGCCKPPTGCGFIYQNETLWTPGNGLMENDPDCLRWSNDQQQLCYNCNSCKAGILASLKGTWRKASMINIVMLVILVIVYAIAYAVFRHNKPMDNEEPYGDARMEKAQPSLMHY